MLGGRESPAGVVVLGSGITTTPLARHRQRHCCGWPAMRKQSPPGGGAALLLLFFEYRYTVAATRTGS